MIYRVGILGLALMGLLAAQTHGQSATDKQSAPEALLPAKSRIYLHFDGFARHQKAYEKTALAKLLREELSDLVTECVGLWRQLLDQDAAQDGIVAAGGTKLTDDEKKYRKNLKVLEKFLDYFWANGVAVGVEIPTPDKAQVTVVLPQGATEKNWRTVHQFLKVVAVQDGTKVKVVQLRGRTIYRSKAPADWQNLVPQRTVTTAQYGQRVPGAPPARGDASAGALIGGGIGAGRGSVVGALVGAAQPTVVGQPSTLSPVTPLPPAIPQSSAERVPVVVPGSVQLVPTQPTGQPRGQGTPIPGPVVVPSGSPQGPQFQFPPLPAGTQLPLPPLAPGTFPSPVPGTLPPPSLPQPGSLPPLTPPGGAQPVPVPPQDAPPAVQAAKGTEALIHWWKEGEHVIVVIGADPVQRTLTRIDRHQPNLQSAPLYKKIAGFHQYESYFCGYVDVPKLLDLIPAAAASDNRLEQLQNQLIVKVVMSQLGLSGIKGLSWHWGFEGQYQRSTMVVHVVPREERQGLLKLISSPKAFDLKSLPPLPPDAATVCVNHIDWDAWYNTARDLYRFVQIGQRFGEGQNVLGGWKDLDEEIQDAVGFHLRKDFLNALDSTVVVYQGGSDGPFFLGDVLAIKVKDAEKVEAALRKLAGLLKKIPEDNGIQARVVNRSYRNMAYRMVQATGLPVAPSYTVHNGWLLVALYPQPLKSYIWRTQRPGSQWPMPAVVDHAIQRGLKAGNPKTRLASLMITDPRPFLDAALPLVPVGYQYLAAAAAGVGTKSKLQLDVSTIPTAKALVEYLSPGVSAFFDDDDALRWESHTTVELPNIVAAYFLMGALESTGVSEFTQRWQIPGALPLGQTAIPQAAPPPSGQYLEHPPQYVPPTPIVPRSPISGSCSKRPPQAH
jgi:hypothetical protein